MQINIDFIDNLLRQGDIEGLIELGAPEDEYYSEAEQIVSALRELNDDEVNSNNIAAIISLIWTTSFNLSEEDLLLRTEAIEQTATQILSYRTS